MYYDIRTLIQNVGPSEWCQMMMRYWNMFLGNNFTESIVDHAEFL